MQRVLDWYFLSRFDRTRSRLIPLVTVGLLSVLYVWSGPEYVRVANASGHLFVTLPAGFKTVNLQFSNRIPVFDAEVGPMTRDASKYLHSHRVDFNMSLPEITIQNTPQPLPSSLPSGIDYQLRVDIRHRSSRPVDIISLAVDGMAIPLSQAATSYLEANGERRLMNTRLIQDALETSVTRFNESIGNYVVTAMTLLAVWLSLVTITRAILLVDRRSFERSMKVFVQLSHSANVSQTDVARREYYHYYTQVVANQRFWRVLGPALGFLFTVTSLVAGIRPVPGGSGASEMGVLFSSLQLALISTVVGLVVRIAAMMRLRLEGALLDKAETYLDGAVATASEKTNELAGAESSVV